MTLSGSARPGRSGLVFVSPPVLGKVDLPKPRWLEDFKTDFKDELSRTSRCPHHPATRESWGITLANVQHRPHGELSAAANHPPMKTDEQGLHRLPFVRIRRSRCIDIQRYPHDNTQAAPPDRPLCGNFFLFLQGLQIEPSPRNSNRYHITPGYTRKLAARPICRGFRPESTIQW